jgi:MinD-like ATPase involved in chromosome partitioning or flagellar assembly
MDEGRIDRVLNDYLTGHCTIDEAAYNVETKIGDGELLLMSRNVYLVPASVRVGDIARVVRNGYEVSLLDAAFRDLSERLELDYLFIDSHPGLNEETLLSIIISDDVFIVLRPDKQDYEGTAVTVDVAEKLEVPRLHLVINMALSSQDHGRLRQEVETLYGHPVSAVLPLSEEVAAAASAEIFSLHQPEHAFSQGIQHLAHVLETRV